MGRPSKRGKQGGVENSSMLEQREDVEAMKSGVFPWTAKDLKPWEQEKEVEPMRQWNRRSGNKRVGIKKGRMANGA